MGSDNKIKQQQKAEAVRLAAIKKQQKATYNSNIDKQVEREKEWADQSFYDPTDHYQNKRGQEIIFEYVAATDKDLDKTRLASVKFKAWITEFSDNFQSNWSSQEVYGRMDSIQTFQSTKRVINLSWDVIAAGDTEAMLNMSNCMTLIRMLYPRYEDNTLKAPPLIRLKFLNLIRSAKNENQGIIGTMEGFNYAPDLDAGVFDYDNAIFPKVIKFQCSFTCLHDHEMSWGELHDLGFPYGGQNLSEQDINRIDEGARKNEEVKERQKAAAAARITNLKNLKR